MKQDPSSFLKPASRISPMTLITSYSTHYVIILFILDDDTPKHFQQFLFQLKEDSHRDFHRDSITYSSRYAREHKEVKNNAKHGQGKESNRSKGIC